MRISSSSSSMTTLHYLNYNSSSLQSSFAKLATGKKINSGADDPSGLIAASYLSNEISSTQARITSAQRASSVASTADGAMSQVSGMMTQLNGLQLANATNTISADERAANQLQMDSLLSSINRVSNSSSFAGNKLLSGTTTLSNGESSTTLPEINTSSLGSVTSDGVTYNLSDLATGGKLASGSATSNPELASAVIAKATYDVSTARGSLGAYQTNDLESTINNLTSMSINMSSSLSSIQDTNYATEFTKLAQSRTQYMANILTLKKQNELTGSILSLLG